ncbi:MAG: FkbM family methyltransferase [Cyanosarcina radialis HA8281-LM2]|jgi:FkbM family methyltransferase|nr:FkbM family methyltransferase [Cyanosarcina radialis HA8281-LM2]
MKLIDNLKRPEYILRPTQIYRRIRRYFYRDNREFESVLLPWKLNIQIRPDEAMGKAIWLTGICDLAVTEVLWRCIEPGEIAIDIGANIGYMTALMAARVGKTGKVYCFEPHPEIYRELTTNIKMWQESMGWDGIKPQNIALSNQSGEGVLNLPQGFSQNRGLATLVSSPPLASSQTQIDSSSNYVVGLSTLDRTLGDLDRTIGAIKIDVEGHELEVLQGAEGLIGQSGIRDIVFEEHRGYPSPVSQFLEERGYTVFKICKSFWQPLLEPPMGNRPNCLPYWEAPSYLATKEPSRALKLMQKRGWSSLK